MNKLSEWERALAMTIVFGVCGLCTILAAILHMWTVTVIIGLCFLYSGFTVYNILKDLTK